jgi:hypothetical protein
MTLSCLDRQHCWYNPAPPSPTMEEIEAERAELFHANGLGHLVVGA